MSQSFPHSSLPTCSPCFWQSLISASHLHFRSHMCEWGNIELDFLRLAYFRKYDTVESIPGRDFRSPTSRRCHPEDPNPKGVLPPSLKLLPKSLCFTYRLQHPFPAHRCLAVSCKVKTCGALCCICLCVRMPLWPLAWNLTHFLG